MKNINWKARLRNKVWLAAVAAALLLAAQGILPLFGVYFDYDKWMYAVNTVLSALTALGIIIDGSTPGIGDGQ